MVFFMKISKITFTIIYAFITGVVMIVTGLVVDKFKAHIPEGLWGQCFVLGTVFAFLIVLGSLCRKLLYGKVS
jgi:hypothetical protein